MKKDSRKLQSEFRDVSSGLKSASSEAKQRAQVEEHKLRMDKANDAFGRAEEEKKKRQKEKELAESDEQKKRREKEEKEKKEAERREKEKASKIHKK
jgi:hypothetical protein